MTTYKVEIPRKVAKSIDALERSDALRIWGAIALLADTPRPPNCIALTGERNVYRIRTGNFRILYEVRDQTLTVIVVRVAHRRDVYRST